jgi:hypothetical protein
MPQVPYNPVPGVRDLGRPIYPGTGAGPIRVQTPELGPDVFGYGVGSALEHFGTVTQQTGQELFGRAEAFKKLDNSNDATNAAIDTEKAQTELFEKLKENEGKNAVDAFSNFNDKLEQVRQEHRSRLTNPEAQREFDMQTRTSQNRLFANGASYAGGQHKVWTDATSKARVSYDVNNVSLMPTDAAQIDNMLGKVEESTRTFLGGAVGTDGKGWSEDAINAEVAKNKSTALSSAIQKLARVDPTTAMVYLKKYQKDGMLNNDDVAQTEEKVRNPGYQVLTRGVVADLTTGRVPFLGQHKVAIERARDAIGGFESSNNYASHPDISTPYGRPLGRYQVMEKFLPDYLKEAGMKPMTAEEFLKDPGKQDELFTKVFQKRMDSTGSFDEAASRWFTGGSIASARAAGKHDLFGTTIDKYLANTHARLAKTAGDNELSAAAQEQGKVLDPNNDFPLLPKYLDEAVKRQNSINDQKKKEINFDNWSTVLGATTKPGPDGRFVQNPDQLFADPAVKRSWDNLTEPQRDNIMKRIHSNIVQGFELTPEKEARYHVLDGMLNTADGKAKFQNEVDLTNEHLPNKMTDALMKKFQQNKSRWGQDEPSVSHVNQAYGSLMNSAGIKKNSEDYWSFISAVQGAWDAHTEQYGKPPSPQEKQAIGAQILQEKAAGGIRGFFGGKDVMYQTIPDEYKQQITKELEAKYGATPQQHQIEREYFNRLYNAMFQEARPRGDRTPVPTPAEPVIPVSK